MERWLPWVLAEGSEGGSASSLSPQPLDTAVRLGISFHVDESLYSLPPSSHHPLSAWYHHIFVFYKDNCYCMGTYSDSG